MCFEPVALWIRVVWCRPSEFWFEASGVLLEADYASRGAQEGSDDYDRHEFYSWKRMGRLVDQNVVTYGKGCTLTIFQV